jgi:hypothetical protein
VKAFSYLCFLVAILCVGLQAGIKDAIDSGSVEHVNAVLQTTRDAEQPVLNDWSISTKQDYLGKKLPVAVTPLMYAAIVNVRTDIVSALFAAGAKPEIQDTSFGDTALHHAVRNNNKDLAELILKYARGKSLTDIKNFSGLTPLDEANDDGMKKLLKHYETLGAKFGRAWHKLGGSLPHDPELD